MSQGNGVSTTKRESLDPQVGRLIDEKLVIMRRLLEERLMQRIDEHMVSINARLDQFAIDIEDALADEDDDGPDED